MSGVGDPFDASNRGRRGIVDSTILEVGLSFETGVSRTLPFKITVRMPDFPAAIPIEVEYVDGLRALGSPINNGVSFFGQTIGMEPDVLGRFLSGEGCNFTLATSSGALGIRPGDANRDRNPDLTDAIWLLKYVILGDPATLPCGDGTPEHPSNLALLDADDSGAIDPTDAIRILTWIFIGGPPHVGGTACVEIPACPPTCFITE